MLAVLPVPFDLGTPQGGVLSPFLFNVCMHRLISLLPDIPGVTITCYADDICIHSTSSAALQRYLDAFHASASACGVIISPLPSILPYCQSLPLVSVSSPCAGNTSTLAHQCTFLEPRRVSGVIPWSRIL